MSAPSGRLDPDGSHRFSVRVYFEDTDFSGHVYHAAYLKFCERARTEFLRAHGVHHSELAREGRAFAVREMTIHYDRPAHIDDVLDIRTAVASLSGARLVLDQTLTRENRTVCRARVTVVLLDAAGRPLRLSPAMRALLAGH